MENFAKLVVWVSFCVDFVALSERNYVSFEDDMYANLLMRAVSGSLYPFDTRLPHIVENGFPLQPYDFEKRKYGLDWPTIGHTMIGWVRLQNVYDSLRTCEQEYVTGDFVEAGEGEDLPCILRALPVSIPQPSFRCAARRSVERWCLHFRRRYHQTPRLRPRRLALRLLCWLRGQPMGWRLSVGPTQ